MREWHDMAPGRPKQAGICEAINRPMQDERPSETLFLGIDHSLGRAPLDRQSTLFAVGYEAPAVLAAQCPRFAGRGRNLKDACLCALAVMEVIWQEGTGHQPRFGEASLCHSK